MSQGLHFVEYHSHITKDNAFEELVFDVLWCVMCGCIFLTYAKNVLFSNTDSHGSRYSSHDWSRLSAQEDLTKVRRAKHRRECHKKVKSDSEKKVAAVRWYLATKGLTWPEFQRHHARQGHLLFSRVCRFEKSHHFIEGWLGCVFL